jgi:hypothetical protein
LLAARISGTTIDAIAEFLLNGADLCQQCDRIERAILLAQPLLHGRGQLRMIRSNSGAPPSPAGRLPRQLVYCQDLRITIDGIEMGAARQRFSRARFSS